MQVSNALKQAKQQLTGSENATLDAELLLCSILQCERSYLYAHPEWELSEAHIKQFFKIVSARREGHPIAHLLGNKDFWSLGFIITPDTLIPRPETEILVEAALQRIPRDKTVSVLELGTGAGVVAIAIASERPRTKIIATDINSQALIIAIKNAHLHGIKNIFFKCGNWFDIDKIDTYDVIISNPPYISENDPHLKQGDVRFELKTALVSGKDGLNDIRTIIINAKQYLKQKGWLLIEHGYTQSEMVSDLFIENKFKHVEAIKDYNAYDRVKVGQSII